MFFLAALISIVLGIIAGFVDAKILFDSTTWFILSIAFSVLGSPVLPGNWNFTKKE